MSRISGVFSLFAVIILASLMLLAVIFLQDNTFLLTDTIPGGYRNLGISGLIVGLVLGGMYLITYDKLSN